VNFLYYGGIETGGTKIVCGVGTETRRYVGDGFLNSINWGESILLAGRYGTSSESKMEFKYTC
jgi:hypothetical protein